MWFRKAEKTARFMALENLQESVQERVYGEYVGRTVSVLVEKESARSNEDMTGHSTCHKVVNFSAGENATGRDSGRVDFAGQAEQSVW